MKLEDCEGCTDADGELEEDCVWFDESLTCPCSICLIKMMCLIPCDLLRKHIDKIHKQRGI